MQVFSNEWFDKHQKALLWFCNTPIIRLWFRWVLQVEGNLNPLDKVDFIKITPSSVRWSLGHSSKEDFYREEFLTSPFYARRLYKAFKPFWYLIHFWDTLFANKFNPALNFGFDSLIANPATGSNSPVDGYCLRQGVTENWSTIRGGNGTDAGGDSATEFFMVRLGAAGTSDNWSQHILSQLLFDTSSLTAAASISAATQSIFGEGGSETGITFSACITGAAPAANTTIVAADYQTRLFTRFNSTDIANGSWNASGYNDFAYAAAGLAAISKTGLTKTCLTSDKDADNSAPTWSSSAAGSVKGLYADNGSNKPKLTVTFALPSAGGGIIII